MALVPFKYTLRSLFVRRSATLLTVFGTGATVAVLAGVLSLNKGFEALFEAHGREDLVVFLRPGAQSEGESAFSDDRADILLKSLAEVATDASGAPLASAESFLAVRLRKTDGGETNVPIRGVQPATFAIRAGEIRIVEGRNFQPGSDEVIVGRPVSERIRDASVGDVLTLNTTPFRVVGIFEHDGPLDSEVWGDVERMRVALKRPVYNRVLAQLRPDAEVAALAARLEDDRQVPAKVQTEREYLRNQTGMLSGALQFLGFFLAVIMGTAAVFTGTNTMLSALASRVHEIGILLSTGFRPMAISLAFLLESLLLGLLGGVVGCLLALPLNGVETGTTNWQTFTEVAFAFRVTPDVLVRAVGFALILGLLGGTWPAVRAARLDPTDALRRR